MGFFLFFLLASMAIALLPLAARLLGAILALMLIALWRLLVFTLECGIAGFRWGMNGGLSETAAALRQAASAIAGATRYAHAAATIFYEEWRGKAPTETQSDPAADFDLGAWQREQEAREQAQREEAERAAREEAERRARAQAEAQARAQEEQRRQEKMRRRPPPSPEQSAMALLGLSAGFTAEDLKRAYRARVKAAHPDVGGSNAAAATINAAYALLKARSAA
jgi:flagellar biosynthesis GTPase FlhF